MNSISTVTPGIGQSIGGVNKFRTRFYKTIFSANLLDTESNPSPTDQAAWSIDGDTLAKAILCGYHSIPETII